MPFFALSILTLMLASLPALAAVSESEPATYILQTTSNLNCDVLNIELASEDNNFATQLSYTDGAFAAVTLPSGMYSFNNVICVNADKVETLDLISEKVTPFFVSAGQTYYGGRVIFEQVMEEKQKVINDCTRIISRARGQGDGECFTSDTEFSPLAASSVINVYIPKQSEKDITTIRNALGVEKQQLRHLPLNV